MLTKPPAQVQLHSLSQQSGYNVRTQVNRIHANYNNLDVKYYMQHANFPNLRVFSHVFLHVFFYTCFVRVFLKKIACNMADLHARNGQHQIPSAVAPFSPQKIYTR